jgi:ectoine hydroxylase
VIEEPTSRAVRSVFDVHRLSEIFRDLVGDPRLLGAASQILGSEVYLHQTRLNYKPAFRGKEFYWHSDFETWHLEDGMPRMRALSCTLLLCENNAYNGPLMLIPGSHRHFVACVGETPERHYEKSLRRQEYGVPDEESLRRLAEHGGLAAATGAAGSVLLFDGNVMHGSSSNISPYPRSNLFFVYNSVENRLVAPFCGLAPRPNHIANRRPEVARPTSR